MSVPAHAKRFNKNDEMMGHVRRYERAALIELLKQAGYGEIKIINYGFPLINFTSAFANILYTFFSADYKKYKNMSPLEKTLKSGIANPDIVVRFSFLFNRFLLLPFALLQKVFFKSDLGPCYIVYGRLP